MTPRQFLELAAALTCAALSTCVAVAVAILTPATEPTEWEGQP